MTTEPLWHRLRTEAEALQKAEPGLSALAQDIILSADSFGEALTLLLAGKLADDYVTAAFLRENITVDAEAAQQDLLSTLANDPAARDALAPFLFFKGFHALQSYRAAHALWQGGRTHLALYLQSRASDLFGVDIHPAAKIGWGVMMDHATGIVIGETATVGDNVLFWHGVTLGGKSTAGGDRHPKIGDGVHLGAGSTVLGAVKVGAQARVAAGSVVVRDVPPQTTVAGIPATDISKKS